MTTAKNLYILVGNLGHDIEVQESNGHNYTHFNVATDEDVPIGGGKFETRVTWIRVTAFGPLARSLACLGKGSQVLVRAHLTTNSREIAGDRYYFRDVFADEVEFLRVKKPADSAAEDASPQDGEPVDAVAAA